MTDEQAIERVKAAIRESTTLRPDQCDSLARIAWNEFKAITQEELDEGLTVTPQQIAREAIAQLSGPPRHQRDGPMTEAQLIHEGWLLWDAPTIYIGTQWSHEDIQQM